jgi:hypothetical protein
MIVGQSTGVVQLRVGARQRIGAIVTRLMDVEAIVLENV